MRTLIVDDEAPARARLRRLLGAQPDVEIVGEASNGRDALTAIRTFTPDVVFLDIQMPGLDGFGVAGAIEQDGAPYIVFVTANDQHALRAFDVGAVDYLLKPFTPDRFARVMDRARERLVSSAPRDASRAPRRALQRLLVMTDGRATFLPVDRIDWAEAERNYVVLHCGGGGGGGGETHRIRATIVALHDRLDPAHFLRINRSTLVRLDAVKEVHEWSHGDYRVVMHDGTERTWSRRFRAAAESEFGLGG